ncbi:hypothetical protein JK358_24260 [Nocardia sp. 2]|uniref:Acyl-CoA synthetase n=1 Tax=Nocardia acididurans TaxID=2802282 RepID=A0ABS1MBB4_9NOCA|nr:hypothetical protein [Nocardia acididurans]MBL1077524.1 hypothetical protein [Nocardia acididurans]
MDHITSPFAVAEARPMYRLRRYFPERQPVHGPAALLIPPLMMSAEVFDLDTADGPVAALHRAGIDPWVIDFGSPATEEGGWTRTLDDHVLAVSAAVDTMRERTGGDIHLVGYCQGGMFGYLTAAHRGGAGLASLVGIGSMVDWTAAGLPFGPRVANHFAETVREGARITDTVLKIWWDLVDPVSSLRNRLRGLRNPGDVPSDPVAERHRRFMAGEGRIGYPGPAASDLLRQFAIGNRLWSGGFVVDGRVLDMSEVSCPILGVVGLRDQLAPGASVRGIEHAARNAPVYEVSVDAGHYKLVAGRHAATITWPTVAGWLNWAHGDGALPDTVSVMTDPGTRPPRNRTRAQRLLFAPPRPPRAGRILPDTRVSLGRALGARTSTRDLLLHDGRAISEVAVNEQVDRVVRTLIGAGIRPGAQVGVVMSARPAALFSMAALSRLGAVAVLLPADGDLATAMGLSGIDSVIADPALPGLPARDVIDLDAVDPDAVRLPRWYTPNAGTAEQPAFVTVTHTAAGPAVERITNRQWHSRVLSAGLSSGLDYRDTLYCAGALHDPDMTAAMGAAVLCGARIALSGSTEPEFTGPEILRYGASVVARSGKHPLRL